MSNIQFDQESYSKLSTREIETAKLVSNGKSAKEVASTLGVATRTAQEYMNGAIRKLGCRNSAHVVSVLIRGGII